MCRIKQQDAPGKGNALHYIFETVKLNFKA